MKTLTPRQKEIPALLNTEIILCHNKNTKNPYKTTNEMENVLLHLQLTSGKNAKDPCLSDKQFTEI